MFKNLKTWEIAGIIAGALILNKILKSKVAVVAKDEQKSLDDVLKDVVSEIPPVALPEFVPPVFAENVPVVKQVEEIKTPFNTPELFNETGSNTFQQVVSYTNEFFN